MGSCENNTKLTELLDEASNALNISHAALETAVSVVRIGAPQFEQACADTNGFGDYNYELTATNPIFGNQTRVNTNLTIFKQIGVTKPNNLIASIKQVQQQYSDNLKSIGKPMWQYAGASNVFGIYPALEWECSEPYFPPSRPWWTASTVGSGNYIFLLDITKGSNQTTFKSLKSLLGEFVSSLSFYDYFTVFSYDVLGNPLTETLMQATSANKQLAISWIERQNTDESNSKSNVGGVLQDVSSYLNYSTNNEYTSHCHNYVVVFSQGEYGINSPHPYDVVENTTFSDQNITVSSFVLNNTDSKAILENVVCRTGGIMVNASTNATIDNDALLARFNVHFSKHIRITAPRFSEVYEDSFGLGKMTTGGQPIYDANGAVLLVNAIDVVVNSSLGTPEQINIELQKQLQCENLDLVVDNSTCAAKDDGIADGETEPDLVALKDVLFGVGVTFSLAFSCGCGYFWFRKSQKESGFGCVCLLWVVAVPLFLVWFWLVYGLGTYPDQVKVNHYKETLELTLSITKAPSECTRTSCVGCATTSALSCSSAKSEMLAPGALIWDQTCGSGYHCCRTRTYCASYSTRCSYSSNYGTSCTQYCSNWVTECIESTSNRQCNIVRGICTKVFVDVEYETSTGTVQSVRAKECGLNQTSCVDDYIASFPKVGSSRPSYYSPWDTTSTQLNKPAYNAGEWVALAIPIVAFIVIIVFTGIKSKLFTTLRDKVKAVAPSRQRQSVSDTSFKNVQQRQYPPVQSDFPEGNNPDALPSYASVTQHSEV